MAGNFKRTMVPTKKIIKDYIWKSTYDITEIFDIFKSSMLSQRPNLDIEAVTTCHT